MDAAARSDQKGEIPLIRADAPPHVDSPPPSLWVRAQPPVPASELSLILELDRGCDDALLRVISLLHRRRCRVTAAEFSREAQPLIWYRGEYR